MSQASYILAFDTANEVIAVGLGKLHANTREIELVESIKLPAHRASNTQLIPQIKALVEPAGLTSFDIACVVCGKGPGSFTGVRICMATAKGIATGLGCPLWAVSTLDALAWQAYAAGLRGNMLIAADAMRKEVYPVLFELTDSEPVRQNPDTVVKIKEIARFFEDQGWTSDSSEDTSSNSCTSPNSLLISGDALTKYVEELSVWGSPVDQDLWTLEGAALLRAAEHLWQQGKLDPFDTVAGDPGLALPVYTRLSDAEENERIRLAKHDPKNLTTGVQDLELRRDQRAQTHETTIANAQADEGGIVYRPLDAAQSKQAAALDAVCMPKDAWSAGLFADDLKQTNRVWWAVYAQDDLDKRSVEDAPLIGFAGGCVVAGELEILKVAVDPAYRRRGIARSLLNHLAHDARDLGATCARLEVRASNAPAQKAYEAFGLSAIGVRPKYYSDKEDAALYEGPLPIERLDVAGMELRTQETSETHKTVLKNKPYLLAIESSCDETAAAIINGEGELVSDVIASQIDFHARFGGVVPEIASRKHIEAICGVCAEAFDLAAERLELPAFTPQDLQGVCVTYAPGLVGAVVVGLAFAKGLAWAAQIPLVGVNHLEGHMYANKLVTPDLKPPILASLVSGGHTLLVYAQDWGTYKTLGSTIDDAVGEAFDKVAKALGLGYPGGPIISKLAAQGNPKAISFPRPLLHSHDLRFSLSGLKTAVTVYIQKEQEAGRELNLPDIAASFQAAVVDVQVAKTREALLETGAKEFCLGGGVAANPELRRAYETMCEELGVRPTLPPLSACTDNAGMIALVGLERFYQGKFMDFDADARAHASLDEPY